MRRRAGEAISSFSAVLTATTCPDRFICGGETDFLLMPGIFFPGWFNGFCAGFLMGIFILFVQLRYQVGYYAPYTYKGL